MLQKYVIITDTAAREALKDYKKYSYIVSNDEKGIIEIKNLVPGKYHLKEVQAPSGYLPYEKEIDISLKLNETVEITVENFKEPEDEEKEVPEETSKLEVGERKEIKKLPRTGF